MRYWFIVGNNICFRIEIKLILFNLIIFIKNLNLIPQLIKWRPDYQKYCKHDPLMLKAMTNDYKSIATN